MMVTYNNSDGMKFLLLGITDNPDAQAPMFLIFLIMYLLTVLGNLIILIVICVNPALHNPMYFFICNLSFLDISYSSVTQPKLLSILITGPNEISFNDCIGQLYVFMSLACTEFVSLTAMAYDRYVAICKPLHYSVLMRKRVCLQMVIICWVVGFLDPLAHTVVISRLPFCKPLILNHFYCDLSLLLSLSCVDKFLIEIMTYIVGSVVALPAFLLTLVSYVFIISTILNISSSSGRHKAFSTCTSHLTVVTLFYGTVLVMHMRPSSHYLLKQDKPLSVLYTAVIPMMNPLIYSFRNKDVKNALRRLTNNKKYI
ncbi:PREDICTED: olfactory receptor 5A2-like [Nanorana parkeri]|uniref:olfactory receptor 5A2-like n=1 Tax=Nanorana parkeri TaxID=125878 RepID=UPI0008544858|nr:PREDICTED: olfactory receptor 5A2-like [Nanorana parkeri]